MLPHGAGDQGSGAVRQADLREPVVVPEAKDVCVHDELDHGIATRDLKPGETFTYYFGSCWSKGDLKTAEDWFAEVEKQK